MTRPLLSEITRGDEETCWSLFREGIDPYVLARLTIPGEPASKARVRFARQGSAFQAQDQVGKTFRDARPDWKPSAGGFFGVFAIFYAASFQRRDVDNMLKLVLDGLNGVAWVDDSQVTEVSGRVARGEDVARTEVVVYWTWPNGRPPEIACETCGRRVRVYVSTSDQRFCGRECSYAAARGRRPRQCAKCGNDFIPTTGTRNKKYCSDECRSAGHTVTLACAQCANSFEQWTSWAALGVPLCSKDCRVAYWKTVGVKAAKGACTRCGGPTSRREYTRCRGCSAEESDRRSRGPQAPAVVTITELTGGDTR